MKIYHIILLLEIKSVQVIGAAVDDEKISRMHLTLTIIFLMMEKFIEVLYREMWSNFIICMIQNMTC